MARSKITALLPACNEQANIGDCIASVAWADEIFVVDSGSTDATQEIARAAGARVVYHDYVKSANQKNWAIPQAAHPWALSSLTLLAPMSHILFGTDFPYRTSKEIEKQLTQFKFTAAQLKAINRDNALKLFPRYR